mmetsp:Transcript_16589/g.23386  ORF Transcript_16589/g.23386 Transcript_16589/m.23386 type:complete len:204 (+) Transcript_16589:146-757(+)
MSQVDIVVAQPQQEGLTGMNTASAEEEQPVGQTDNGLAGGVVNISNMKKFSNSSSSEETCDSSKSDESSATRISALTVESVLAKEISSRQPQTPSGKNVLPREITQNSTVRVWRSQRKLRSSQTIRSRKLSSYGSLRQLQKRYSSVSEVEAPRKSLTNKLPDGENECIAAQNKKRMASVKAKFMELALTHNAQNLSSTEIGEI